MTNADGSQVTRLQDIFGGDSRLWDWSPDGKYLLFSKEGWGYSELQLFDLKSRSSRLVDDFAGKESSGSFSADSGRIVFASKKDKNWEIYVCDVSTKKASRLTDNNAMDWDPDWGPR